MKTYVAWTTENLAALGPRVLGLTARKAEAEKFMPHGADIYAQTQQRNFRVQSMTAFRKTVGRARAEVALDRFAQEPSE
jgi:hypothetical protein